MGIGSQHCRRFVTLKKYVRTIEICRQISIVSYPFLSSTHITHPCRTGELTSFLLGVTKSCDSPAAAGRGPGRPHFASMETTKQCPCRYWYILSDGVTLNYGHWHRGPISADWSLASESSWNAIVNYHWGWIKRCDFRFSKFLGTSTWSISNYRLQTTFPTPPIVCIPGDAYTRGSRQLTNRSRRESWYDGNNMDGTDKRLRTLPIASIWRMTDCKMCLVKRTQNRTRQCSNGNYCADNRVMCQRRQQGV